MSSILITGVEGFVGGHTARLAAERGLQVHGVVRAGSPPDAVRTYLSSCVSTDLAREWPPVPDTDAIVHLAGLTAVGPSFVEPQRYIGTNTAIVTQMCEALVRQHYEGVLLFVSSGSVYAASDQPLDEHALLNMASPYAVSKVAGEFQVEYYRNRGLRSVVVRPFNHLGPGQSNGFFLPDLARDVLRVEGDGPMAVGNLHTRRDYLDVRDVAAAYLALALAPSTRHTTYNVCSGLSVSGMEILDILVRQLGRAMPHLEVDEQRLRPSEVVEVVGDATRLRQEFDWEPRISLETSIRDFVHGAHTSH